MKVKIIISEIIDFFVVLMPVGLLTNTLLITLQGYVDENFVNGQLQIDKAQFTNTYFVYVVLTVLAIYILYTLFNIVLNSSFMFILKGRTLGMYLQNIEVVSNKDENLQISTIIKRQVLYNAVFNFFTLYIFKIVDIIRVLLNKEMLINRFTNTKIIYKR